MVGAGLLEASLVEIGVILDLVPPAIGSLATATTSSSMATL
jgi:hypothetical protein